MQQTYTILKHDGPNHLGLWCKARVVAQTEFKLVWKSEGCGAR